MGKGSSSSEHKVIKERPDLISKGTGTSKVPDRTQNGNCIFLFHAEISLNNTTTQGISTNQDISLTLGPNGHSLDLFIGNRYCGMYHGPQVSRMVNCILNGYSYEGKVEGIRQNKDKIIVVCRIQGLSH